MHIIVVCFLCYSGAFCTIQVFSELVFPGNGVITVYTTVTSGLLVHILGTTCEYIRQRLLVFKCLCEIVISVINILWHILDIRLVVLFC